MKNSHYVFIGVCIVWILFQITLGHTELFGGEGEKAFKEIWDKQSLSANLGQVTGSLVYPGIAYGIYLLIEWLVRKPKKEPKSSI